VVLAAGTAAVELRCCAALLTLSTCACTCVTQYTNALLAITTAAPSSDSGKAQRGWAPQHLAIKHIRAPPPQAVFDVVKEAAAAASAAESGVPLQEQQRRHR
jgi:hypothetical protein